MAWRRPGYAVLGLFALVVLALVATSLTATTTEPGGTGTGADVDRFDRGPELNPGFEIVEYLVFGIFALLVVGGSLAVLRYPLSSLKGALQVGAGGIVGVLVLLSVWLLWRDGAAVTFPTWGTANRTDGEAGTGTGEGGTVGAGTDDVIETITRAPELLVVAGVGLLAIGVIAAALLTGEAAEAAESVGSERRDTDMLAAIGAVAGETASRLEGDAPVENEVYRAYKRMTALLDVDAPRSTTPGEFRDAAVAAGVAPDDVAELVRLFEGVRYGDREVTDDRARRAVDALRRIESTYGESSAETSAP